MAQRISKRSLWRVLLRPRLWVAAAGVLILLAIVVWLVYFGYMALFLALGPSSSDCKWIEGKKLALSPDGKAS